MFDVIIVRRTMLAENFGAWLLKQESPQTQVLQTDAQVSLKEYELEIIRDKKILIVGGYYTNSMKSIKEVASSGCVFLNEGDAIPPAATNWDVVLSPVIGRGFATVALTQIDKRFHTEVNLKIVNYLDQYLYGWPSNEAMAFQNGIYLIDCETDLEKLLTIRTEKDVEDTIANGETKRRANFRIAQQRFDTAIPCKIALPNDLKLTALLAIGDSPIVDTCAVLAEHSENGVGILMRYDLKRNRTLISVRVRDNTCVRAADVASSLCQGGGGSHAMGGGSIEGFQRPTDLFVCL